MEAETISEKKCSKCGTPKPFPSRFGVDRRSKSGRRSTCKDCDNARKLTPKAREARRRWEKANAASRRAKAKIYRARYYEKHSESRRAMCRARYWENHKQMKAKRRIEARKRRTAKPHEIADCTNRARARRTNAPAIERIDRAAIIARDQSTCYLCGCKPSGFNLTLDHVVPLKRGGSHTADNLKVACRSCNTGKANLLLDEYLQKRGRVAHAKEKTCYKKAKEQSADKRVPASKDRH